MLTSTDITGQRSKNIHLALYIIRTEFGKVWVTTLSNLRTNSGRIFYRLNTSFGMQIQYGSLLKEYLNSLKKVRSWNEAV